MENALSGSPLARDSNKESQMTMSQPVGAVPEITRLSNELGESLSHLRALHTKIFGRPPVRIDYSAASHTFSARDGLKQTGVALFSPSTQDDADRLGRLLGVLLSAGGAVYGGDQDNSNLYEVIAALAQAGFGDKPDR